MYNRNMPHHSPTITAVVLTYNEASMIVNCLETLQWCDQILIVDSGSTDMTIGLAERAGAKVIKTKEETFARRRNSALQHMQTDWMIHIDADERVTPALAREIQKTIRNTPHTGFSLRRNNIHYGKWMEHGGWERDVVERVFRIDAFEQWTGEVHESPHTSGTIGSLQQPLVHLTHRNVVDGLRKSIVWTGIEAELLHAAGHPPVRPRTLFRKTIMELVRRAVFRRGYKDGTEGWIEAWTQAMNRFLVYARLWELQRSPSLQDAYQNIDATIVEQWNTSSPHKKDDQTHE